jgi:hypothetical protein
LMMYLSTLKLCSIKYFYSLLLCILYYQPELLIHLYIISTIQ